MNDTKYTTVDAVIVINGRQYTVTVRDGLYRLDVDGGTAIVFRTYASLWECVKHLA